MNYKNAMTKAMDLLAQKDYLFVGQSCAYYGTAMFNTLVNVPMSQRLEFLVAEELQMGVSCGMSLEGIKVCSLFPRMDFLMRCMDSLINHLDKIELLSEGRYNPKVIIRTSVGGRKQLDPGLQHLGNYIEPLRLMLKIIQVVELGSAETIYPAYEDALRSKRSSILVEFGDAYE